jgi:branched-chain amino acid transport system ATP-binding protein
MMLEARRLCKAFGGVRAVNLVDLHISEGEISSIIGPNGAGKTTLFNLLTGHLNCDSGQIIFKGENISKIPSHMISQAKLARSFQITSIFPNLSVFDNVQLGIITSKKKNLNIFSKTKTFAITETEEILESVGLCDQKDFISGTLSHGDKKKLDIAIALACKPELLLLDEPSSGMSPAETRAITNLIQKLARQRGLTLVFIEHDMSVVFGISEKIRVMHQGSIIAEGTPEEIRRNEEVQSVYLG